MRLPWEETGKINMKLHIHGLAQVALLRCVSLSILLQTKFTTKIKEPNNIPRQKPIPKQSLRMGLEKISTNK